MSPRYIIFTIFLLCGAIHVSEQRYEPLKTRQTVRHGTKEYVIDTYFKGNFFAALKYCKSFQMQLLSIEEAEENQFIYKKLSSIFGHDTVRFWTSGNRLIDGSHWNWFTTDQPLTIFKWAPEQPDGASGDAKCLNLCYGVEWYSKKTSEEKWWDDDDCDTDINVICEKDIVFKLE